MTRAMQQRIYVGNLDSSVSEDELRQIFEDAKLKVSNVIVKDKYAFIDCPDQAAVDAAIDKMNGFELKGSKITVEPSVSRRKRTNRIVIRGLQDMPTDEIERLVAQHGTVAKFEVTTENRNGTNETLVHVTYESPEQAQFAVTQLTNNPMAGDAPQQIKADFAQRAPRGRRPNGATVGGGGGGPPQNRLPEFPLRVLVPGEMVGAIIGRKGETIKKITSQTRARVDVHRKEAPGVIEKQITIFGNPENCSNACKEILKVIQQESASSANSELVLKVLAHNNLCGRLIGKGGTVIRTIMTDTSTRITVSSMHDVSSYNLDRVITIRGELDAVVNAESIVSQKLKASFENDLQALGPQNAMFPGLPVGLLPNMMPHAYNPAAPGLRPYGAPGPLLGGAPHHMYNLINPMQPGAPGGGGLPGANGGGGGGGVGQPRAPPPEEVFLYVPNQAVGAIIGTKGANIRQIIRMSGSQIRIAPLGADEEASPSKERLVTITGSPEAQWKAQYHIFEKIKSEGFGTNGPNEEPRLHVEISVPKVMVGRIIGKGGQNVREIQRLSGVQSIRVPEDKLNQGDEVPVQILGHFFASQSAQRRIRGLISTVTAAQNGPLGPRANNGAVASLPPPRQNSA